MTIRRWLILLAGLVLVGAVVFALIVPTSAPEPFRCAEPPCDPEPHDPVRMGPVVLAIGGFVALLLVLWAAALKPSD